MDYTKHFNKVLGAPACLYLLPLRFQKMFQEHHLEESRSQKNKIPAAMKAEFM